MNEPQRWKIVEYSIQNINKAGDIIRDPNATPDERKNAFKIIDNWRAAHAYPMHVIYIHLRRISAAKYKNSLVVERLKRLDSIVSKLEREPHMLLSRMQDLGGCRVIVPTLAEVRKFAVNYQNSRIRHKLKKEYDYIACPKASGYRSLHLVYKFHSDKKATYNKSIFIEIQIRTHLQHLWATALETMGLFTRQALKAGEGDEYVKRFFALVSSLFALEENAPIVPNTFNTPEQLLEEVRTLNDKYHILQKLQAIRAASINMDKKADKKTEKKGYYVLRLSYTENIVKIFYFSPSKFQIANQLYTTFEQNEVNNDTVLVQASSFIELQKAYPNYFSDIGEFISIIQKKLHKF